MEHYPKSILEFHEWFATDDACLNYLEKFRWPNGFICPGCGHDQAWQTKRRNYKCSICGMQTSVTAGTIFHNTRKPLRLWFEAIWHITSQKYGANALGLQRILDLGSYNTAWKWLHRLRRAMVRADREKLSGTIEVDETYIGGEHSGKRGRGAEHKSLVIIAVEDKGTPRGNGIGRIRLKQVADASANSLIELITSNILIGSKIRTDSWSGYNSLTTLGYKHETVSSHELTIVHLVVSLLKRWLLGTYQGAVNSSHLDYYLEEYTFRFNRRTSSSRGKLFYRLIQQAVLTDPIVGRDIVGGNQKTKDQSECFEDLSF